MATVTGTAPRVKPLAADGYEKFLAIAAIALLVTVLTALVRGQSHWGEVPWPVWVVGIGGLSAITSSTSPRCAMRLLWNCERTVAVQGDNT